MSKRLVQIAKELNVGTSTIVEFLNSNGFEIENKPTVRLSDDMHNALMKEFKSSADIKSQADKINIGFKKKEEGKTVELPKIPGMGNTVTVPPIPGVPKKVETPEEKPKVDPPVEQQKEEPKTVELPKQPVENRTSKEDLVDEEKTTSPSVSESEIEKEKETAVESDSQDSSTPQKQDSPEVKEDRVGVKVVGKIDLDADKKKKEAAVIRRKEEEEKAKKEAEENRKKQVEEQNKKDKGRTTDNQDASKEPVPKTTKSTDKADTGDKEEDNEIITADAPELRGLKIQGKIDINKFKRTKKKDDKSSKEEEDDKGKKKKRRRRRKLVTEGGDKSAGNRRNTKGGKRTNTSKGNKKDDETPQVSQKEIEEKIKATMARLQGGKSRKRQKLRRDKRDAIREKEEMKQMEAAEEKKLSVTEFISVQELANLMDVPVTDVITTCLNLGVIVSINQRLDAEIIELLASEYGHEVDFIDAEEELEVEDEIVDSPEDLLPRAPIVTVMGHVDHGKTSLLDFVRKANVAGGEAGGITQHIGAYEVQVGENQKRVTFLDTPGHEAFTAMRARGAKVTDIAVIIIAADDRIMPQTKEAISHAQAAGVPMVFAINKIDKPGADAERIKGELAEMNLLVEDWGGKYQSQDISAKTGLNIELLLEKIVLEAEILELKANPDRMAFGTVLEASLEKGKGYVTNALVQAGTLKIGDPFYAGEHAGRVKALFNDKGKRIQEAGPSQPVSILGLSGAPQAGEKLKVTEKESESKAIANKRAQILREHSNRASKRISLDEIGRRLALGNFKELNLIVKGDVDGSVEALADSLIKQSMETVQVNVIHKAVGQIVESDVLLASASDAIIIGFQVRPSLNARKLAETEGVEIKMYSIIYKAIEEIRAAIEGLLEPTKEENILGSVLVRETFKISKVGTVAGCFVEEGKITRNSNIRIIRDGIVIYPTKEGVVAKLSSLKRFKDDAKEVRSGFECGLTIENFNDIKVGDTVEPYEIVEVKQTLE